MAEGVRSMKKDMPWLRLYTEIIDDEKLRLISFQDRWHYIAILCCKRKGILDEECSVDLRNRKIAVKLGIQPDELDQLTRRLEEVGLVNRETMQPTGWRNRQFDSDVDETAAERKRRQREREKEKQQVATVTDISSVTSKRVTRESRVTGTNVTPTDTDTDTDNPLPPKGGPFQLPDGVDPAVWAEFEQHRVEIKKPLTDQARTKNANLLAGMTKLDQAASVDATIRNRWTGIFPAKVDGKDRRQSSAPAYVPVHQLFRGDL